tara:strand:- start:7395 stop:8342 length:948 start_codon:yes stop_codon:yes gene_type:complete
MTKRIQLPAAILAVMIGAGCEAPLNMEQVVAEQANPVRRFDMFQAAAQGAGLIVVVSSMGSAVVSDDNGNTWNRSELPGRPSLIDVTACSDGSLFALDTQRRIWQLMDEGTGWESSAIDTTENTLSIHCAPDDTLWVSASFSTLYSRAANEEGWREFSLYEDLQFTAVRFVDASTGFAVGEFGTVLVTTDGGASWDAAEPVPNEFYPMAADFMDESTGWVGGLDGVIWQTRDGAQSWERQSTPTSTPVYNISAGSNHILAAGGSAKLVKLIDGQWENVAGAPEVFTYIRGLLSLDNGALLVAGGGGTLEIIEGTP